MVSNEFDNDERFVRSILEFLIEIGWISEYETGKYIITPEGLKDNLNDLRF